MPLEVQNASSELAPHRPLTEFYEEPAGRVHFVADLFDRAAPDYNFLSGALSFWTDRQYRKYALRKAGLQPGMKVLDVASGTGLVAQGALDLGVPRRDLVGLDPSRGMLQENRKERSISLIQGFGERLPFCASTFDFVSMGYALRHVEDLGGLFRELYRVLRAGGRILILEITRPSSRPGFALMRFYMRKLVPFLTRLSRRHDKSARLVEYYWATIAECVLPEVILGALKEAGFTDVARKTTGNILSEYVGTKS